MNNAKEKAQDRKEEILKESLDKHNINYDTNYIDDSERAFDAIKEAMEAYARERAVAFIEYMGVHCDEIEELYNLFEKE